MLEVLSDPLGLALHAAQMAGRGLDQLQLGTCRSPKDLMAALLPRLTTLNIRAWALAPAHEAHGRGGPPPQGDLVLRKLAKGLHQHGGKLQHLRLQSCRFGPAFVQEVFALPNLQLLDLEGSDFSLETLALAASAARRTDAAPDEAEAHHGKLEMLILAKRHRGQDGGRAEKRDYEHLPKLLRSLPRLKALDLSGNACVDLQPLGEALSSDPELAKHVREFNLDRCPLKTGIPPSLLRLGLKPEELALVPLRLATWPEHESDFVLRRDDDRLGLFGSSAGIKGKFVAGRTASLKSTSTGFSTGSESLDPKNKAVRRIQKGISKQLDDIYEDSRTQCYYEMAKLAFITLLEGAQILRTGVRNFDAKVAPSMGMTAAVGSLQATGPAAAAAALLGAAVPKAVKAVPGVGSVLEFAFERYATFNFNSDNERIAKVLDISGNNIRLFADTMARCMTSLHKEEIWSPKNDLKGAFWKSMKMAWGDALKRAQEFAVGRSAHETVPKTLIRLLATQHAKNIVMAMASGDADMHAKLKEATETATSYETDQLKVEPALQWHIDKHLKDDPPEADWAQNITWGELEGLITMKDLDADRSQAQARQSEATRARAGRAAIDPRRRERSAHRVDCRGDGRANPRAGQGRDEKVLEERMGKLEKDTKEYIAGLQTMNANLEQEKANLEQRNANLEQRNASLEEENADLTDLAKNLAASASSATTSAEVSQALEKLAQKSDLRRVDQEIFNGIDQRIANFEKAVGERRFASQADFDETARVLVDELEQHRKLHAQFDQRVDRLEKFIRHMRPQLTIEIPSHGTASPDSEASSANLSSSAPLSSSVSIGRTPTGTRDSNAAEYVKTTRFTHDEMSGLLSELLMRLHANGEASRNDKFADRLDFSQGQPMFKATLTVGGTLFASLTRRQPAVELKTVAQVLGGRRRLYTLNDLESLLKKLGIRPDHPAACATCRPTWTAPRAWRRPWPARSSSWSPPRKTPPSSTSRSRRSSRKCKTAGRRSARPRPTPAPAPPFRG